MFDPKKEVSSGNAAPVAPCSGGERRWLLLAHAVLWATLTIAAALVSKATAPTAFQWLLTTVLLPGWLASEQILRRALRPKPMEGACP